MISNQQLQQWIEHELHFDPRIDGAAIAVHADDGAITLRGTVGSFREKREAERATKRVSGVRSVENELTVRLLTGQGRADAELRGDVLRALELNGRIPDTVDARVVDGWVTLVGSVQREDQRSEADYVAGNVPDVLGLSNAIEVEPQAPHAHDGRDAIHRALARSAAVDATKLSVETHDATVSLSGSVGSHSALDTALAAAWAAPGVSKVDDHVVIDV
jgi:osmotically-inducible protein OsmY